MLTLNKLIYQIYEALQISVDDTSLDKRLIIDVINQERTAWIRKEQIKNRSIDSNLIQDLGCVPVSLVEKIPANCCDISIGCQILRTDNPIPNAIELKHGQMITRVGSIDFMNIPIHFMEYDAAVYYGNGRFNSKALGAFLRDGYLYLIFKSGNYHKLLEKINIQGVFEDPTQAATFVTCDGVPCFSWDTEYPINAWMWQTLIKPAVINELKSKRMLFRDEENNSKDDAIPSVVPNLSKQGTDPSA